jgi:hypothetical protein
VAEQEGVAQRRLVLAVGLTNRRKSQRFRQIRRRVPAEENSSSRNTKPAGRRVHVRQSREYLDLAILIFPKI